MVKRTPRNEHPMGKGPDPADGPLWTWGRARSSDPSTSKAAARYVTASGVAGRQSAAILSYIKAHPGLTSQEIARGAGMSRSAVTRRCPEMREAGWIRNGEPRRCEVTGRQAMTWEATDA